jgi:probable phosphoglycerate mutase
MYLVRHGEAEGDYPQRYLGRADPCLSVHGLEQARALAEDERLAAVQIWSSPARRALETARHVCPAAVVEVTPLAQELDFGVLDGLLPAEAARLFPEACRQLETGALNARSFGGEDWTDLWRRAARLRPRLEAAAPVILVSHRYFLRALAAQLIGLPVGIAPIDLGCGEVVVLRRHAAGTPWTVDPARR